MWPDKHKGSVRESRCSTQRAQTVRSGMCILLLIALIATLYVPTTVSADTPSTGLPEVLQALSKSGGDDIHAIFKSKRRNAILAAQPPSEESIEAEPNIRAAASTVALACTLTAQDEASLNAAIACANGAGAGTHTIQVTQNILLSQSTLPISNALASTIIVEGNGFTIDGQHLAGVRLLEVRADTSVELNNLTLVRGNATDGGGILNYGWLTINHSTVRDNQATRGGGIFTNIGGWLIVNQSTIHGNQAQTDGGGIYANGIFTFNQDAEVEINESTISNNIALGRGGGLFNFEGPVWVANSTFMYNRAATGGAIDNVDAGTILLNSTVSSNQANRGGAVRNENSDFILFLSTLTANQAIDSGGGDGIRNENNSVTVLDMSIVANQFAGGTNCLNGVDSEFASVGYNLDSDGSCNLTDATDLPNNPNVQLGPLQLNGGSTLTHALLPGSAAIDAGDLIWCLDPVLNGVDQRGMIRPQGQRCDSGAYEYQFPGADLGVRKQDLVDPIMRGDNIAYRLTVTNNGPEAATGIVLTDQLPAQVTYVSSAPAGCITGVGNVTCNLGNLAVGASTSVDLLVATGANTPHFTTNQASVTGTVQDLTPGNNTVAEDTLVCDFIASDEASLKAAILCANAAGLGVHTIEIVNDIALSPSPITVDEPTAQAIVKLAEELIDIILLDPSAPLNEQTLTEIINLLLTAPEDLFGNATIQEILLLLQTKLSVPLPNVDLNAMVDILLRTAFTPIFNPLAAEIVINGNGFTINGNSNWVIFEVYPLTTVSIHNLHLTGAQTLLGTSGIRNFGALTLNHSTIYGNKSSLGSIIDNLGELRIVNSTLSGNQTNLGGTVSNLGHTELFNSTVTNNKAEKSGALFNVFGHIQLYNTLVADQVAGANCAILFGQIISEGHNLDSDNTCKLIATGDIPNGNAHLGPLQDNGGPTLTHALLTGSDAIDAAKDAVCNVAPVNAIDQRGVSRYEGAHCDIGAYEVDVPEFIRIVESDGISDVKEGDNSIAGWWISLSGRPSAPVTVYITPDHQIGTTRTMLQFDESNWHIPILVYTYAYDDAIAEGDHTGLIKHTASSNDLRYNGANAKFVGNGPTKDSDPSTVLVYITDNDHARVNILESNGISDVAEGNPQVAGYTVALNSQPLAPVTIEILTDDQITINKQVLTFSAANWNVPQQVLISAVDNDWAEGDHTSTIQHKAISADPKYNSPATPFAGNGPTKDTAPSTVLVYITDNDLAGVDLSAENLNLTEAGSVLASQVMGNNSSTYTVKLTSQPRYPVLIDIVADGQVHTSVTQLVFDPSNWNVAQNVIVTTVNDDIAEGPHTSYIHHTVRSDDGHYQGLAVADVVVAIADDDSASVGFTIGTLAMTEGSSSSYGVALTSQPASPVTIQLTGDEGLQLGKQQLVFDTANWHIIQEVPVTSIDNQIAEGLQTRAIHHTAASADAKYNSLGVANVVVQITDNDHAGVNVTANTANLTEGDAGVIYQIVLTSEPLAPVTIAFENDGQVSAHNANNGTQILFDKTNWNVPQNVKLTAIDDAVAEGQHAGLLLHHASSTDATYDGIAVDFIIATVHDNDKAAISTKDTPVKVTEGKEAGIYQVALSSQPHGPVVIDITVGGQVELSTNRLVFQPATWNVAQKVSVKALDDDDIEGTHAVSIHHTTSSSDPQYNGVALADVTGTITDNDVAGLKFKGDNINVTEGDSESKVAGYQLALTAKPRANVTIIVETDGQTLVTTGSSKGAIRSQVLFTPETWNVAQTIYVTAVDDKAKEGPHTSKLRHQISSTDSNYSGLIVADLIVQVADNDSPSASVKPGTITVKEGAVSGAGIGVYAITLMSKPAAAVIITANTDGQVLVNGFNSTDLIFTVVNWNAPQTVTVTAPDNQLLDDGRIASINHTARSDDAGYAGLTVAGVKVTIHDDDALSDPDGDGVPTKDEDRNGNGDPTDDDTDGDGIPDYLDPDDDGDGIPTADEDHNGDGFPGNDDTDGDGIPDYLDNNEVIGTSAGTIYLPLVTRQ